MKRFIAILMATMMILSLCACGKDKDNDSIIDKISEKDNKSSASDKTKNDSKDDTDTEEDNTYNNSGDIDINKLPTENKPAQNDITSVESYDPLQILNTVYSLYTDTDELYFPAAGGDMLTEDTTNWEGPANVGLEGESVDFLTNTLHFPADSVSKINDAASLMHAMNGNTFTCGAYKVSNPSDISTLVVEIKASIGNAQWMCGSPEQLFIATVGDVIVVCYGSSQLVDDFCLKLMSEYPGASLDVYKAITA